MASCHRLCHKGEPWMAFWNDFSRFPFFFGPDQARVSTRGSAVDQLSLPDKPKLMQANPSVLLRTWHPTQNLSRLLDVANPRRVHKVFLSRESGLVISDRFDGVPAHGLLCVQER